MSKPHQARYKSYLDDIRLLGPAPGRSTYRFVERVEKMELLALRELDAFCQQIDSISTRI